MAEIVFTVTGAPAPQGSKRHVGNGRMIESSAAVKPWREAVKGAALAARRDMLRLAVDVDIVFHLKRPRGHYGTGRNAGMLRLGAPLAPKVKPDLDKLIRSTLDALSDAGMWDDDCQVCRITARKTYAEPDGLPGAAIRIREVES